MGKKKISNLWINAHQYDALEQETEGKLLLHLISLVIEIEHKNPAYGRHWTSRPMQILAPIPKRTEIEEEIFLGVGQI